MFEKIKLEYHFGLFLNYGKIITEAIDKGDIEKALRVYERFRKHAQKYQELYKKVFGTEDLNSAALYEKIDLLLQYASGKINETKFKFKMSQIEEKYKPESQKREEELKKQIRKEFLELGAQFQVLGEGQQEYVAGRMIDMYRIAIKRLDGGKNFLQEMYVDNPYVPESLKDIIKRFVDGKISKEDAVKELTEMQEIAKQCFEKMKIKVTESKESNAHLSPFAPYFIHFDDKEAKIVFYRRLTEEDKLKADIIADSMTESGEIDKIKLFLNVAELAIYDEMAKLAEKLGDKRPTPNELIDAMIKAYERTYETKSVPDAFENEEDFRKWLKDFSSILKENKEILYKETLPAYQLVKNLRKKKI